MTKNYSIDHEPKLSNILIMSPHFDEKHFFFLAVCKEFVEIKLLISYNLAGVIYMPKKSFHTKFLPATL